jgi:Ca-activated chloride channel family protein
MRKSRFDSVRVLLLLGLLLLCVTLGAIYPLTRFGTEWLSVTWQKPWWLLGLLALPLVLYFTTYGRDRRTARLKVGTLKGFSGGPRGLRARLVDLPGAIRTVGLAFCIVALARPVSVLRPSVAEEEGIDLVVALDLSGSMEAVMENLPPDLERYVTKENPNIPPTRLDAAKAVLRDFISRRQSDRIGAVVFGRNAYVVSPPTLDYQLLDTLVARMELKLIDPRGTAIGDALGVAVARLRNSSAKSKAVVLLTDGDNQHGTVAPEYAAHSSHFQPCHASQKKGRYSGRTCRAPALSKTCQE